MEDRFSKLLVQTCIKPLPPAWYCSPDGFFNEKFKIIKCTNSFSTEHHDKKGLCITGRWAAARVLCQSGSNTFSTMNRSEEVIVW